MIGGADAAVVYGYLLDDAPSPNEIHRAAGRLGVTLPDGDAPSLGSLAEAYDAVAWEGVERGGREWAVKIHGARRAPTAWAVGIVVADINSKADTASFAAPPQPIAEQWRRIATKWAEAFGWSAIDGPDGPLPSAPAFHVVVAV